MWNDTGGALLGNDRPPPAVGRGHSERLGVFGKLAALPSGSQRQDGAFNMIEVDAAGVDAPAVRPPSPAAPSPVDNVIELRRPYRAAAPPRRDRAGRQRALRGLGIGATLTLCLPVLLMVLPLVGFLLLPLLPLIGLSWSLSLGDRPSAPTDRPRAPATCASALPPRLAQAA